MGTIRQIATFDGPDGFIGSNGTNGGGSPWALAFPLATLAGSTIVCFNEISATNGPVITGVVDNHSVSHTLLDNLRNTNFGAEYWSSILQNAASLGAGWCGRASGGTSTTLADGIYSTKVARGATAWTTNQWAGKPYKNFASGDSGTVTANDTSGNLTISGMGSVPSANDIYAIGDYIRPTQTGTGDYYGGIGVEISGVAASSLVNHDKVQGDYTNGATISCPTHALGSSPVTIIACCLNDTNVVNTPAIGSGFTSDGTFLKWDQSANMARLQHVLLSNPGTTGATFAATAADHYQAMYVALLDASAGGSSFATRKAASGGMVNMAGGMRARESGLLVPAERSIFLPGMTRRAPRHPVLSLR